MLLFCCVEVIEGDWSIFIVELAVVGYDDGLDVLGDDDMAPLPLLATPLLLMPSSRSWSSFEWLFTIIMFVVEFSLLLPFLVYNGGRAWLLELFDV